MNCCKWENSDSKLEFNENGEGTYKHEGHENLSFDIKK